jgi:acyl-CoA reductase-like NAD-dependent aldehyde dehydrogenase/nicotinamidase-related amidase
MKPALLLVDLQTDYLAAPGLQPIPSILTARAGALLQECRLARIPIIHIWTTVHPNDDRRMPHWKEAKRWICVSGTAGHQPPPPLQPLGGEVVTHKSGFNPFMDFELDAALKKLKCDCVVIAGLHLHACVRTAAVECLERGLRVWIAEDAVASNDPIHAAATRRWLSERQVQFDSGRNILMRIRGNSGNPALIHCSPRNTKTVLFETPIATPSEIAKVSTSAKEAWAKWRETDLSARWEILKKLAPILEAAAPGLAKQMALEIGKPLSHGLEEIRRAAANVRDVALRGGIFQFQKREAAGMVRYEPLGAVAIISPWNNPVAIPIGKIAPALVYGNVVVWKPAPAATRISGVVLKLLRNAGVPENAVQILTGDHTTAQALASDKHIGAVTITSSAQGGFALQEICARRFIPLQAELSGNNAAIVWNDADLAAAASAIASGAFGFAGQRCTANRRVIVNNRIIKKFASELKRAVEKMVWGDPANKTTDIGPVISAQKRDEHADIVLAAKSSGAARQVEYLFADRVREAWVKRGAYAQPVIAWCDKADHPLVQEETMSPLLVLTAAEDFDEALRLCNGVRHGLVASLFSNSPALHQKFLREARAGMLKINASTAGVDVRLPFGGWKASAVGPPEHGESDPLFYTRAQAVYD